MTRAELIEKLKTEIQIGSPFPSMEGLISVEERSNPRRKEKVFIRWFQPGGATYSGYNVYVVTLEVEETILEWDYATCSVASPSNSERNRKSDLLQKFFSKLPKMVAEEVTV